jgi:hypothetical protein
VGNSLVDYVRRKIVGLTEYERWQEMYKILFPNDNESAMPTPCKY